MNIDKLDKIIMSHDDMLLLFKWRDNHKDYVRSFKSVLENGCIVLGDNDNQVHIVFEDKGGHYQYSIYKPIDNLVHRIEWGKITKIGITSYSKMNMGKGANYQYNESVISLHASLMAYMEYYSDVKEYIEVKDVSEIKVKNRKKTKAKNKKKSVIRISKKIYNVKINNKSVIRDSKRYERKMEKWTVRGHWRKLKNGQKVWIKSHVKGEGKEVIPKEYKL